ncbi:MAG: 1-deoxy-D-xylulose-5-phosphate reductoisomerase [Anaerovoracaceae bacterium]|jgi:1-deoxy-D-xylulose-5-phosphate reductoisomerase
MVKKIAILGSTGSIGTQALDVCDENNETMKVVALACGKNVRLLSQQITKYAPALAVCAEEADALELQKQHPGTEIMYGREGLIAAATGDCDIVLNALMGIRGLEPTYKAICAGRDIALANKETLVAGGELVMKAVADNNVQLLPVDSEHSAIFQCLQGNSGNAISRILLTGSGGPFRTYSADALQRVTREQALRHPRWKMGPKITIDSATMMNKGLEVIEAKWLFGVDIDQIQVVIHPQSIVHSMVEFEDSAVIAQLGVPDMKVPIAYALTYPRRVKNDFEKLDFSKAMDLKFEKPDMEKFRCLKIAYEAITAGGAAPVIMNGANEVLVDLFLKGKIRFTQITRYLENIMNQSYEGGEMTLEGILAVDEEVRARTLEMCGESE